MTLRTIILFVSLCTCLTAGAYAASYQDGVPSEDSYLRQIVGQLEKNLEKKNFQAVLTHLNSQSPVPVKSAQQHSCPLPTDPTEERCVECGKTRMEAAHYGHPHKPPYVFQSEQKQAVNPVLYKKGSQYFFRDTHGHIIPLAIPVSSPTTAHSAIIGMNASLSRTKYPPYW